MPGTRAQARGAAGPGRMALLLALAAAALAPAAPAAEGSAAGDSWSYELAGELMSPFCPGRALPDCPSRQAESLVSWISAQEEAGRSQAEVEAELVERYGESILAAPPARGLGLVAYAVPALAFVAGGALLAVYLLRQGRGPGGAAPGGAVKDPELERLVDAELAGDEPTP